MRLLLKTILFLLFSTVTYAASPVIFYSDLTSGPNSGGENNNGVYVTVWGKNFGGSNLGPTAVVVGSGQVNNIKTWTDTQICFQLGSSATSGNIVVTTGAGSSNGIPFTVRSGNIYFVNFSAGTNGNGAYATPFNTLATPYSTVVAGDTVYVLSGTIPNAFYGYGGSSYATVLLVNTSGTQASPIAWVAYPNATVTINLGGSYQNAFQTHTSGGVNFSNWNTFAKFNITGSGNVAILMNDGTGERVVGNKITMSSYSYAIISLSLTGGTANNDAILGNEIYNSGAGMSGGQNQDHSIYWQGGGSNVEIGWNYMHGNKNYGYEISAYHYGPARTGNIHDNLIVDTNPGDTRGINIGSGDSGDAGGVSSVYNQNIKVYNNIMVNLGQETLGNDGVCIITTGTTYFYNNTIYGSGVASKGMIQFPLQGTGPGGGNQVVYFANNILYNTLASDKYLSDGAGNNPTFSIFPVLAYNNYYGEGNGPTQDTTAINGDPKFVTNGSDFHLQSSSPDIGVGYNTTATVANDYDGVVRPNPPDVGSYQYISGSCSSNGNSCSVGSQCCSTLCQGSLCVSCLTNGGSCSSGIQCCSATCTGSVCVASPQSSGIKSLIRGQCVLTGNVYL